jgi:hypothetical protein
MAERIQSIVLKIVSAPEPHNLPALPLSISTNHTNHTDDSGGIGDLTPTEDPYPRIIPSKAKQAFDSPEGFGDWHVLMGGDAIKCLRDFRKQDQNIYSIVVKKIKELSNGFFSADNHKRLVGGDKRVHIYEAKMTGDLRLVYRIDLQNDEALKVRGLSSFVSRSFATLHRCWADRSSSHPDIWHLHSRADGSSPVGASVRPFSNLTRVS